MVAVDYGLARTGIARTDYCQTVAIHDQTLVGTASVVVEQLVTLLQSYKATEVVVGWPLSLRGHTNTQCVVTQVFLDTLTERWSGSVHKFDERFTSVLASERYGRDDDAYAALALLENFLGVRRSQY